MKSLVIPCTKGTNGTPCGRQTPGPGPIRKGDCPRCWVNARSPAEHRANAKGERRNAAVKAASPPCVHRGPDLTGPERQSLYVAGQTWIVHGRRFALCLRPGFVYEGQAVCQCPAADRPRCGPTCDGYSVVNSGSGG